MHSSDVLACSSTGSLCQQNYHVLYKLYLGVLFLAAAISRFNHLYAVSGAIRIFSWDKTRDKRCAKWFSASLSLLRYVLAYNVVFFLCSYNYDGVGIQGKAVRGSGDDANFVFIPILRHAIRIIIHNNFDFFFHPQYPILQSSSILRSYVHVYTNHEYASVLCALCCVCVCVLCVSIFWDATAVRAHCVAVAVKFMIRRKF